MFLGCRGAGERRSGGESIGASIAPLHLISSSPHLLISSSPHLLISSSPHRLIASSPLPRKPLCPGSYSTVGGQTALAVHQDILLPILEKEAAMKDDFDLEVPKQNALNPVEPHLELSKENLLEPDQDTDQNSSPPARQFEQYSVSIEQLRGWNWGEIIFPGIWSFTNNIWFGLLAWVSFFVNLKSGLYTWVIIGFILGYFGNKYSEKMVNLTKK
jgi:hypothetical protein